MSKSIASKADTRRTQLASNVGLSRNKSSIKTTTTTVMRPYGNSSSSGSSSVVSSIKSRSAPLIEPVSAAPSKKRCKSHNYI